LRSPLPRAAVRLCLAAIAVLLALGAPCRGGDTPRLAVFTLALSPQAAQVLEGLQTAPGLPAFQVLDAGGDWRRGQDLVNRLAESPWDLLLVLGTPALELTARRIKGRPVAFAMVANPYFTGAAYDPDHPEVHQGNITGLASPPPLATALEQGRKLFPELTRWGLLFDPREGSSLELQQMFLQTAPRLGITPLVQAVETIAAAPRALEALIARGARVIFIPPDANGRRTGELILESGRHGKIVVVNGNPGVQGKGAVLTVTLDYPALGRDLAALAGRLLAGEKPAAIPIRQASPVRLDVNERLLDLRSGYPAPTQGLGSTE